ncbi:MAG: SusC/RagA family TonB-linked outer membrane protein [Bacteroidota bacterium]
MKKLSLVLVLALFAVSFVMAQRTVTGTVVDENGESLIGVSILAKNTSTGTVTDIDGTYSIKVPDGATTLVFSYTGFGTQEVALGASNVVDLTLKEAAEQLSEVVVTGLGIRKEKKALGYGVTTIGSKDVALKPEADVGRILRGKVPGVDITSTSGLAGTGTNVIIRGYSSITGNNQPLFVVDGVPFNADTNSDRGFTSGGATASSRFLDLDPNNIAEISILKGLSATVLYGEAGRNGVVLITTKGGDIGNLDKKMEVTISQSMFATQVAGIPETQQSYGNGWQNDASNAFSNWGAPFPTDPTFDRNINGITNGGRYELDANGTITHPYSFTNFANDFPELQGQRIPWQWNDNLGNFFNTGLVNQTSLAISNRLNDGTAVNFNYGFMDDEGFVPNNDLQRHNFGMGISSTLSNGLKIGATFNFTHSERNSPPASPIYSSNPIEGASLFSNILYTPVSHDLFGWPYENPKDRSSVYYRSDNGMQNPRWTSENINDNEKVTRFFGNVNFSYNILDNLTAVYRLGVDNYTQRTRYSINKGGPQIPDGGLFTRERLNTIIDQTATLNYSVGLSEDLSLDLIGGVNLRREERNETGTASTQQFVYGLNTHDNFTTHVNFSWDRIENTIGGFATATLGFRNFLYLNLQARNDWTSTLETDNRSILYPSASLAFIATDAIPVLQNNNNINYLKFRVGYGTSAGYPDPYQTRNVLGSFTNQFVTQSGQIINTNTVSNRFGNPDLEPETHREYEFGVEGRFLGNRVGIDLSLYDKESSDLIIDLELDPSTGFTNSTVNSAKLDNRGIELGLNLIPIKSKNFVWDATVNFTRNRSRVLAISEGIDRVLIDGLSFLGNFAIAPVDADADDLDMRSLEHATLDDGQYYYQYGVIEGVRILRDEETGLPIVGANGIYQADPDQGVIGDPNPDFTMNFINSFSFKGLTFRFQFDWQQGGDIWGSTASTLTARGIAGETDFDRFVPVVVEGLKEDADGNLVPNDIQVTANDAYWRNTGVWYDENRIFDATTVRLREISLGYDFPKSMLDKTPFGAVSLVLSGQNLWYDAVNFPDSVNFDPEVLSLGVGNGRGFDFVTGPTSKRFGGTLLFTF